MERAPLRPVPSRPPGPIAPAEALSHVTAEVPGLDEQAACALAFVALVGRTREEIADASEPDAVAQLAGEPLAEALARGRKALRRRLYPLPGSGWCERAERLISDRLDDALEDPGPARLEVHLANCSRCVEHERRLVQSQDALVAGFVDAHHGEEPEGDGTPPSPPEAEAADEQADPGPAAPLLRAVENPILLPGTDAEALPAADPPEALPEAEEPEELEGARGEVADEPAQLDGVSGAVKEQPARLGEPHEQPAQLDGASGDLADQPDQLEAATTDGEGLALPREAEPAEQPVDLEPAGEPIVLEAAPVEDVEQVERAEKADDADVPAEAEERPPAAAPMALRRSSATLWSPAAPSPPRRFASPEPPAPLPLRPAPATNTPPPQRPAATPPPSPPPATVAPSPPPPAPSAPSATPPAAPWTSEPPRSWSPPPEAPSPWRSDSPRPALAAHRSLSDDDIWTTIGPLVAILSVAVMIAVLAALLAM